MQDVRSNTLTARRGDDLSVWSRFMEYLPRGNTLDEQAWRRRHRILEWVLALHVPCLIGLGFVLGHSMATVAEAVATPVFCLVMGQLVHHRRWASFFITGGLVFCSMALVLLSRGSIEAHFHFFIIIGFIALYQDWVPFLWNVAFTVLSHGIGTIWLGGQIFNHPAAQQHPWLWSFIHGVAVLLACVGVVIFWRVTEDEQRAKESLGRRLVTADAEIGRRQFTSDMLINLARRNQSMLYRQLDIINHLEDKEQDPDALADLFALDHLATRVRRNAESLLVLAGEQSPRTWSAPVVLRDVVRAAIAETEDLDRVVFAVDDQVAVSGASVADLTHLLAELTENAVRFSPPETVVTIRARPNRRDDGGQVLTVEDWGVGMPPDDLAEANDLLAHPREVDLAVSQRLGFHVVARLAARHRIAVSLNATPGSGITAVMVLPATLFTPEAAAQRPDEPDGDPSAPDAGPTELAELTGPLATAAVATSTVSVGPGGSVEAAAFPVLGSDRVDPGSTVVGTDRPGVPPPAQDRGLTTTTWAPALPAPFVDAGPVVPTGPWHGWWSPESQKPAAFAGQGSGSGVNGGGLNGGGLNGGGLNGSGGHGSGGHGGGANGGGPNRGRVNGGGTNGGGPARRGPNGGGHGPDPVNGNGAGARPDDAEHDDRPGRAADGPRPGGVTAAGAPGADRSAVPAPGSPAPVPPSLPGSSSLPGSPSLPGSSSLPGSPWRPGGPAVPDARRAAAPPTPGGTDSEGGRPEPEVPGARDGGVPSPGARRAAAPEPRDPFAALPSPRIADTGARAASPGPGRGLRRRVPQSHLAPELRHAANGLADTAAPLAADAAASALSRYQASRLAAQSVVDLPDGHRSDEQGEPS